MVVWNTGEPLSEDSHIVFLVVGLVVLALQAATIDSTSAEVLYNTNPSPRQRGLQKTSDLTQSHMSSAAPHTLGLTACLVL
jgi:hypothetical protein